MFRRVGVAFFVVATVGVMANAAQGSGAHPGVIPAGTISCPVAGVVKYSPAVLNNSTGPLGETIAGVIGPCSPTTGNPVAYGTFSAKIRAASTSVLPRTCATASALATFAGGTAAMKIQWVTNDPLNGNVQTYSSYSALLPTALSGEGSSSTWTLGTGGANIAFQSQTATFTSTVTAPTGLAAICLANTLRGIAFSGTLSI